MNDSDHIIIFYFTDHDFLASPRYSGCGAADDAGAGAAGGQKKASFAVKRPGLGGASFLKNIVFF